MRQFSRIFPSVIALSLGLTACGGSGGAGGGNALAPDDVAPSVSITQPAPGSVVSGVVSMVATASDNVGVTGVRFLLNGVVLGPDDTEPPYQQSWDASLAMGGLIQLTAIARDAAGNEGTSTPVQVSIVNTGPNATLIVAVNVTGSAEDPDGYSVLVDGTAVGTIAPGTTAAALSVATGSHRVQLAGVAGFCEVTGETVQTVDVQPGLQNTVSFDVICGPQPAGQILFQAYTRAGGSQIEEISADGTGAQVLVQNASSPAWNADRSRMAFVADGEILLANGDGTSPVPATSTPEIEDRPRWSPDGTRLLYTRPRRGGNLLDLFIMNADGSSQRPLFSSSAHRETPAWSPDGTRIAYAVGDGNLFSVWTAKADGTGAARLTREGIDVSPAWSPDGNRIAYRHADGPGDPTEIFIIPVAGGRAVNVTQTSVGEQDPEWSPDGEWIAFAGTGEGIPGVWIMRADGSLPQRISTGSYISVASLSWR